MQRFTELDRLNGDRAEAKALVDLKFDPACDDVIFQINRLPVRASTGITGVSELVRQSARGADQILAAAAELNRQAAALRHEAKEFVSRVRAA